MVASVRGDGAALKSSGVRVLADDFEALVQSQEDFAREIEALTRLPLLLTVIPQSGSPLVVDQLEQRLVSKLARAFPREALGEREI